MLISCIYLSTIFVLKSSSLVKSNFTDFLNSSVLYFVTFMDFRSLNFIIVLKLNLGMQILRPHYSMEVSTALVKTGFLLR